MTNNGTKAPPKPPPSPKENLAIDISAVQELTPEQLRLLIAAAGTNVNSKPFNDALENRVRQRARQHGQVSLTRLQNALAWLQTNGRALANVLGNLLMFLQAVLINRISFAFVIPLAATLEGMILFEALKAFMTDPGMTEMAASHAADNAGLTSLAFMIFYVSLAMRLAMMKISYNDKLTTPAYLTGDKATHIEAARDLDSIVTLRRIVIGIGVTIIVFGGLFRMGLETFDAIAATIGIGTYTGDIVVGASTFLEPLAMLALSAFIVLAEFWAVDYIAHIVPDAGKDDSGLRGIDMQALQHAILVEMVIKAMTKLPPEVRQPYLLTPANSPEAIPPEVPATTTVNNE